MSTIRGETAQLFPPDKREEEILDEVSRLYGLSGKIYKLCKARDLPSPIAAYATNMKNMRYIIYDEAYFHTIDLTSARRTMFHEMGHHLGGHVYGTQGIWEHQHDEELEADYFSGATFAKIGVSLSYLEPYLNYRVESTASHPSGRERKSAFIKGYKEGRDNYVEPSIPEIDPQKVKQSETAMTTVVTSFIALLGSSRFKDAYALQSVNSWGSYINFSSKRSFGGITQAEILTEPFLVEQCSAHEDGYCKEAKIYVRYMAKDNLNDDCFKEGKIYEQFFWVTRQEEGEWRYKITKTSIANMECVPAPPEPVKPIIVFKEKEVVLPPQSTFKKEVIPPPPPKMTNPKPSVTPVKVMPKVKETTPDRTMNTSKPVVAPKKDEDNISIEALEYLKRKENPNYESMSDVMRVYGDFKLMKSFKAVVARGIKKFQYPYHPSLMFKSGSKRLNTVARSELCSMIHLLNTTEMELTISLIAYDEKLGENRLKHIQTWIDSNCSYKGKKITYRLERANKKKEKQSITFLFEN